MQDYLIVGLGNPGDTYARTRHNIGWLWLDALASHLHTDLVLKKNMDSYVGQGQWPNVRLWLAKPTTFMNLSGKAVQQLLHFYKVPPECLLVVCDDVQLPFGKMRFRSKGSSGGQNGLQSVIQSIGTPDFARLRIGIGPLPPRRPMKDFVLDRFSSAEWERLPPLLAHGIAGLQHWIQSGSEVAMQWCNGYQAP